MQVDEAVLARYRRIYHLDEVTAEQVEQHVALERTLTDRLLASTPETRWQTFSDAYSELYVSLPWLNAPETDTPAVYRLWAKLLGAPKRIFEIGSGKARLLRFLLAEGHRCVATEITPERGTKHLQDADGLEWHVTDGINLARFEEAESYDALVSTQVIEHFHPDDAGIHFANARTLLKPGGRYFFDTPHPSTGPHDLSKALGMERAVFMHLKEYSYRELRRIVRAAGFRSVASIVSVPRLDIAFPSRLHLSLCCLFDAIEDRLVKSTAGRRRFRTLGRLLLIKGNVWMVATR